jgi:hypothetical protein
MEDGDLALQLIKFFNIFLTPDHKNQPGLGNILGILII